MAKTLSPEEFFGSTRKTVPPEEFFGAPVPDVSWMDEAHYQYDKTSADYENWGIALEAKIPLGEFTVFGEDGLISRQSPVELYGREWLSADYEGRKELIKARREKDLLEEHADVIAYQEEMGPSSSAQMAGMITKTFATPTSLVPLGHGWKAATIIGGLVGLQHEASTQAVEGELDVLDLAKSTAIGMGGGLAANRVESLGRAWMASRRTKNAVKALDNKSKTVNDEILNGMADGLDEKAAVARAKGRLNLDDRDVLEVFHAGKLSIPSKEKVAKFVDARANAAAVSSKNANVLERIAIPISTRIRSMSEPVFGRLRKMEANLHERTATYHTKISPFMERASKLKGNAEYVRMERALLNGQRDEAKAIAAENFPDMVSSIDDVSGVMDEIYDDLSSVGLDLGYQQDYFPRVVKDLGGLREKLGLAGVRSDLDEFLDGKAEKMGLGSWTELPADTRDVYINQFLAGKTQNASKPDFAKQRAIEEISEELQEHYHSAPESLLMYVDKAVKEAEKRRFFGGAGKLGPDGKIDVESSVGALVAKEKLRGKLTPEMEGDLRAMLIARFTKGEEASHTGITALRSLQTSALLGQFDSAIIQLGDLGSSAYMHGIGPTIRALGGRKGVLSPEEMGVLRNVAADLDSSGAGQWVVDKSLRWSGFRAVDRLGKGTLVKAAHIKHTALAKKKPEKIVEQWGGVFGDETSELIADLKAGRMSENVKLLLFNELSDVQPISLSEMPESYLNNPNGRILYALKSFGLKQLDLIKRTSIDEMRKGNYAKGFGNLARYAGTMGVAGGTVNEVRNWMQTGEFNPEDIPDETFETLMTIMFVNDYSREKYLALGKPGEFLQELLLPAAPQVADTFAQAAVEFAKSEEERNPEKFERVVKDLPVMGKMAYFWLLGGAEKKLERERKKELKEAMGR